MGGVCNFAVTLHIYRSLRAYTADIFRTTKDGNIHMCFISRSGYRPFISGVFRGGVPCARPPSLGRTAVIFVTILGLFLAPFRDKIAATSDQMHF